MKARQTGEARQALWQAATVGGKERESTEEGWAGEHVRFLNRQNLSCFFLLSF